MIENVPLDMYSMKTQLLGSMVVDSWRLSF